MPRSPTGKAPAACCVSGLSSSLSRLLLFALLLLPGALQINPCDPAAESPCREDQLLAGAAVLRWGRQGAVVLSCMPLPNMNVHHDLAEFSSKR